MAVTGYSMRVYVLVAHSGMHARSVHAKRDRGGQQLGRTCLCNPPSSRLRAAPRSSAALTTLRARRQVLQDLRYAFSDASSFGYGEKAPLVAAGNCRNGEEVSIHESAAQQSVQCPASIVTVRVIAHAACARVCLVGSRGEQKCGSGGQFRPALGHSRHLPSPNSLNRAGTGRARSVYS